MEIMPVFVGWPAERRNEIPPSLIFEFQSYSCSRCDAALICHEPTRKKHWDRWQIVCRKCAEELMEAQSDPYLVLQERDKAFERHWHKG